MTLIIVALAFIIVSAVFQGLALKALSNKALDIEIRKKKYTRLKLIGYGILIPAIIILVYDYMV